MVSELCASADCVPTTGATTRGKMDWKKAKKEALAAYVGGKLLKKGKQLEVSVYTKAGKPTAKKVFPLVKGQLSAKNLTAALDMVKGSTKGSSSAAKGGGDDVEQDAGDDDPDAKPKAPTVTAPSEPKAVEAKTGPTPREADRTVTRKEVSSDDDSSSDAAPVAKSSKNRRPFLVIDLGNDVLNRQFKYRALGTNNLREYEVRLFSLPGVKLQLFPFALAEQQGALAGLGLEAAASFMPFLSTSDPADVNVRYQTQAARGDAGLLFRIAPFDGVDLGFTPFVGLRFQNFLVGFNANQDRVQGLPNVFFTGLRAGLGIDVNIADGAFSIFGKGAYIPLLGFGEIGRAPYFPNRNGYGLEGEVGLGVRIIGPASIRASFLITRYRLTFTDIPDTAVYYAAGASDQYLGGNIALRLQF